MLLGTTRPRRRVHDRPGGNRNGVHLLLLLVSLALILPSGISFTTVPTTMVPSRTCDTIGTAPRTTQTLTGLLAMTQTTSNARIANRTPARPFIIERIQDCPNENVYRDIADMCINVFFKEQLDAEPDDRLPYVEE